MEPSSRNLKKLLVIGDEDTLPLFRSMGALTRTAKNDDDIIKVLRRASENEVALAIVLKHIVNDEERIKREARRLGITLLILPSRWAPPEPIDINKLIARALGLG